MDIDKIMARWCEYIRELFEDNRSEIDIRNNNEGPPILKVEVEEVIKHRKNNKAPEPDKITKEELEVLGELGIEIITRLLNDIYNSNYVPSDLLQSVFIALPKEQGAVECEDYRTISLMNHVTKILLCIVMRRIRGKIKQEIAEEQYGFVEGKSTSNPIYVYIENTDGKINRSKDGPVFMLHRLL